jgi:hypothetical protein
MVEKLYVTYNQVCTLAILPIQSGMQARMRYVPQRAPTPCICVPYETYNVRHRACTLHPTHMRYPVPVGTNPVARHFDCIPCALRPAYTTTDRKLTLGDF